MPDQYLAVNAALYPERTAFEGFGRSVNFAALEGAVQRLAHVLAPLKAKKPRLVALDFQDPFYGWMVFLALARLSLPSAILPPAAEGITQEAVSALMPEVIIAQSADSSVKVERMVLSAEWFRRVLEKDPPPISVAEGAFEPEPQEDMPLHVGLAGASAGGTQPIILTRRQIRAMMSRLLWLDAVTMEGGNRPIFVSTVHPSTVTGLLSVCSALTSGALVRFHNPANPALAFAGQGPFLAILTPAHLATVLESLEPAGQPRSDILLIMGGGRASDRLLARCKAHFTPHIRLVYATDETGPIAVIPAKIRVAPEHAGPIMPWAEIKIQNDQGELLPYGQSGEIWLRVAEGVTSYQTIAKRESGRQGAYSGANARYFRKGWFFSGDRGKIVFRNGLRELWLEGRADDLVTLGGGKYDLAKIDAVLSEDPRVKEAGSFLFIDTAGQERLACAVVPAEGAVLDFKALSERFKTLYPGLPPMPVFRIARLPRDNYGMIERPLLAQNAQTHIPKAYGGLA